MYIWEQKDWPHFTFDSDKISVVSEECHILQNMTFFTYHGNFIRIKSKMRPVFLFPNVHN